MKKSTVLKFSILVLFLVGVIWAAHAYGVKQYLNSEVLDAWVMQFGVWAPLVFILLYALVTIVFLPGTPLSILAGVFFGVVWGTAYVVVGATIGAFIAFLVARFLGEDFVEGLLKNKFKKLSSYNEKLEKKGFLVVVFLRLIPLFPFNGLNFALGLTKVKGRDYLLGTLLGIIPGTFIFVFFGNSLATLSIVNIVVAIILLLMLFSLYPVYKKYKRTQ